MNNPTKPKWNIFKRLDKVESRVSGLREHLDVRTINSTVADKELNRKLKELLAQKEREEKLEEQLREAKAVIKSLRGYNKELDRRLIAKSKHIHQYEDRMYMNAGKNRYSNNRYSNTSNNNKRYRDIELEDADRPRSRGVIKARGR